MNPYPLLFTRTLSLNLILAAIIGISQGLSPQPAQAQSSTPPITQPVGANALTAPRSNSPHYPSLVQLREDWARRDPALKGPAQLDQQQTFQQRAMALGQAYESWLQNNPQSVNGWLELAEIHFVFLNRFDTAENYLSQALNRAPEDIQANIAQAEFDFFFKKDTKSALQRLENGLQNTPSQPELLITLVDLSTRASNDKNLYADLQTRLSKAREQFPQHQQLQYIQAFLSAQQAALSEKLDQAQAEVALAQYEALYDRYPIPQYALETAQIARQLQQADKAHLLLDRALSKSPDIAQESRLWRLKGDVWLEAGANDLDAGLWTENLLKAQRAYERLVANAELLVYPERVQFFYNLGLLAYTEGRASLNNSASEALVHLNRAAAYYTQAGRLFDQLNMINAPLQQDLAKTYEMQGMVYQRQNDVYKAREAFQKACELRLESSCKRLQSE